MKAIVLEAPRKFSIAEREPPKKLQPDEALVRVRRVGICGTDVAGYLGKMPFFRYPVIPGHELGVEVAAIGEAVQNVRPGDRCSVEPYLNDLQSFASRRGRPNCCDRLEVLGVHRDGGLRPEFALPSWKLHVSATMTYDQLALVETLAIGCHAIQRGRPQEGEPVLVIGAGPIGLSVVEFARIAKVKITVLDMNKRRLEFCQKFMGVKRVVFAKGGEADLRELERLTGGNGFPLVLDATGNHHSMSQAANFVAHTGRLVFVGITTQEVCFPHPLIHRREMTLLASRNALPEDFSRIIGLVEEGAIDTRPWITHRSKFERLIDDFPAYTLPQTGVIKAMVEVS